MPTTIEAKDIARLYLDDLCANLSDSYSYGRKVVIMKKYIYFTAADFMKDSPEFYEEFIAPSLKDFQLHWDRETHNISNSIDVKLCEPKGVDFSALAERKGVQVRVVRAYSIETDTFPCLVNILYRNN